MNTFQSIQGLQDDYHQLTRILCEENDFLLSQLGSGMVTGFCVKLSLLNKLGLSIHDVLSVSSGRIIIDAESDRLDHWIKEEINTGRLSTNEFDRLLLTVQVKRDDAIEQLTTISQIGLKTVLVAGNNAYLTIKERQKSAMECLTVAYSYDSHLYFGIGSLMQQKLKALGIHIAADRILELQGYQQMNQSNLWCYYAGEQLTSGALAYLSRRGADGTSFLCNSKSDIEALAKDHKLFVYIDAHNSFQYLFRLHYLSKSVNNGLIRKK